MKTEDIVHAATITLYGAVALVLTFLFALWREAPVAGLAAVLAAGATYIFQIAQYLLADPDNVDTHPLVGPILLALFAAPILLVAASILFATLRI